MRHDKRCGQEVLASGHFFFPEYLPCYHLIMGILNYLPTKKKSIPCSLLDIFFQNIFQENHAA